MADTPRLEGTSQGGCRFGSRVMGTREESYTKTRYRNPIELPRLNPKFPTPSERPVSDTSHLVFGGLALQWSGIVISVGVTVGASPQGLAFHIGYKLIVLCLNIPYFCEPKASKY
jgi:hypothetical protein